MIPLDFENICDTIGIHPNKQIKLVSCNINSIDKLVRNFQRLKDRKLRGLMKHEQEVLYQFVCWFKEFEFTKNHPPNCFENGDFVLEGFEKFTEDDERIKYVEDIMLFLQDEERFGESMFTMYLSGKQSFHRILEDPDRKEALLEHISDIVQQNLSESLKKNQLFELDLVITKTAESILSKGKCPPLLVYGPTQSGKSSYKAVVLATCLIMKVPVIIITKEKAESLALHEKLEKHAENTSFEGKVFTPYNSKPQYILHQISMDNGIAIVLPDQASQINRGFEILEYHQKKRELEGEEFKFALIIDEADAMLRTKNREQKMEQGLWKLINLKPCLHIMVTATPQPIMLYYKVEAKEDLSFFKLDTDVDYSGLENMIPLQDQNGKPVYLDSLKCYDNENIRSNAAPIYNDELEGGKLFDNDMNFDKRAGFPCDSKVGTVIPFTNEKIKSMYDLALSDNRQGTLLLDCTARFVWRAGNMFEKAALVQELYAGIGKHIVIVVFIGKGLSYRLPGQKYGFLCKKERTVHDIISIIDNSPQFGYSTPIFIFGYRKMRRVISYRSNLRVPTHLVMYLTPGFSVENLIQALGRATFNGKSILTQNGRSRVIYLTSRGDSQVGLPYIRNTMEVMKRKMMGDTLAEAMDGNGKSGKLPFNTNYHLCNSRKTGNRKKAEEFGLYINHKAYESLPMALQPLEEDVRDRHFEDPDSQAVLDILCDERNIKENEEWIYTNDIKDIFANRFLDGDKNKLRGRFNQKNANRTINILFRDKLVYKGQNTQRRNCICAAPVDRARISRLFLNHQLLKNKKRLVMLIEQKRKKLTEENRERKRKRESNIS